ncbi:hypothetical protein [Bdellovibrio bacteriovorus]|uniref:hypothetical protein n=1 Tax=Bdellovibrio bacteriovorus TaxID=959 RepID=UPI003AA861D1
MPIDNYVTPKTLSNDSIKSLLQNLTEILDDPETKKVDVFTIDIRPLEWASPAALLVLEAFKDVLAHKVGSIITRYKTNSNITKLGRAIGLIKKPATIVDYYEENISKYTIKIEKVWNRTAGRDLPKSFTPHIHERTKCTDRALIAIDWSLGEIIDNAGAHGYQAYEKDDYPKPVYVCGFSYKDRVEIAVLDCGIGIHKSLKAKYPALTAKKSLEFSTQNKVTGHPTGSAGFGLHGTRLIADHGAGELYIWSSDHGIKIKERSVAAFNSPNAIGTLIVFSIKSGFDVPLGSIIKSIDEETYFEDMGIFI